MSQETPKAHLPDRIREVILDAVRDKDRVDMGEVENAVTAIVESINHLREVAAPAPTSGCGTCVYCDPSPSDVTHFHRWAPRQCERPDPATTPEVNAP